MTTNRLLLFALLAGLVAATAGSARADEPPPAERKPVDDAAESAMAAPRVQQIPPNLEELLRTAMESNPEVLMAEAKLRQAEAELQLARLKAVKALTDAQARREQVTADVVSLRQQLEQAISRFNSGMESREETAKREDALRAAQVTLSGAESEIRYLLGVHPLHRGAVRAATSPVLLEAPKTKAEGALATWSAPNVSPLDRIVAFQHEGRNLGSALDEIQRQFEVVIVLDPDVFSGPERDALLARPVNVNTTKAMPLSALLQAIADTVGLKFDAREYGAFLTNR